MKQKPHSWRPFGQSSLSSALLSKSRQGGKQSISLSEFLDKKIGKSSRKSIQEKQRCFASIGSVAKDSKNKSIDFVLDEDVFKQFRHSDGEIVRDEGENFDVESTKGEQNSNKRATLSGEVERTCCPKYMVVLGDDPKPKLRRGKERFEDHKEKLVYNHYENGSGCWDGDREGIDTEEVGNNEAWEGMGSTTLGGLEWH
ncbi:hypothetical protein IHE45_02G091900 [Dioscorea alata]|uniref:Uncharacterized protein n=1 Tax=Dioscorea alata TaxID=55571 RepID=A0ACB7WRL1_DIOAL|nr:hypothetical protein IHE45_02G091900 [Dioscorea alata]